MRNLLYLMTVLTSLCVAQEQAPPQASGARELFYFGTAPKDALPPATKPAAPATAPAKSTKSAAPADSTAALHLGLRYTLLLVGKNDSGQTTDPERNFHKGECVAVNLEANRSSYLYVLAKESSGDWEPLFPAAGAQAESNRIDPGQVIRMPRQGCFEIDDPPGSDTLFVVLSRNPRDIAELSDSIKSPGERTNKAVEQVAQEFGTRELSYRAVIDAPPPKAPKIEPQHAVYVVSGSQKPATTLVTRVEIKHK